MCILIESPCMVSHIFGVSNNYNSLSVPRLEKAFFSHAYTKGTHQPALPD